MSQVHPSTWKAPCFWQFNSTLVCGIEPSKQLPKSSFAAAKQHLALGFSELCWPQTWIPNIAFRALSKSSCGAKQLPKPSFAATKHHLAEGFSGPRIMSTITRFSLSPRKVRERGCCSSGFAKAGIVAAKVKRKDSRKTFVSTKS